MKTPDPTRGILERHREKFGRQLVLRKLYHSWYERMSTFFPDVGTILEVGCGPGSLKAWAPRIRSSDVLRLPWLDLVCNAQALPFLPGSVAAIVGVDVLHHVPRPARFLHDAEVILRPGGRVVLTEPHISLASLPAYGLLHSERIRRDIDLFDDTLPNHFASPMDGNLALSWLLFVRHRRKFRARFPNLRLVRYETLGTLVYPLSGGYDQLRLVPDCFVPALERLERWLAPVSRWLAFRSIIVLEKRGSFG